MIASDILRDNKIEEFYEGRKDHVRDQIERKNLSDLQKEKMIKREEINYEAGLYDLNQIEKINKDVAIIIPTHLGHRYWLAPCIRSCKETGYYVLLVFDNPFWRLKYYEGTFPSIETMELADSVVFKHRSYMKSVGVCHFWNMLYGLKMLKGLGFKLVFNINGDCVLDKPENFEKIVEMLGDADLIMNQWEPKNRYAGTMGWFGKVDIMIEFFMSYLTDLHMYSRTTEGRLFYFIQNKGLKVVPVVNSEHRYKLPDQKATWVDILGFRHIHAEHKVRRWEKMEPPDEKYYDFSPDGPRGEYTVLHDYWSTGDKKFLHQWWGV